MSSKEVLRVLQSSNLSIAASHMESTIVVVMELFFCLLALIALTYTIAYVRDRYFPRHNPNSNETNSDATTEMKTKIMWLRLTPEERAKILNAFFEERIYLYKDNMGCSGQECEETDLEKGEAALALNIGENGKTCAEPTKEIKQELLGEPATSHIHEEENSRDAPIESEREIKVLHDQEIDSAVLKDEKNDLTEVDDLDHERTCCVCLIAYEEGNQLMTGTQCNHVFHYACCMAWLNKNIQCPYCRRAMITEAELLQAAGVVLEPERVKELRKPENPHGTIQQRPSAIVSGATRSATISTTSTSNRNESGSARR